MSTVRYGILGASRIAQNKHIPASAESGNSVITAIASRILQKAEQVAEQCGITQFCGSYDDLLGNDEIDAVINTLPNSLHYEWTIKALEAGKHVLCEKPLAMTKKQAAEMFTVAKKNKRVLMEGFIPRFHSQLAAVREVIDSGQIGEVKHVFAELTYPIGDWGDSRTVAELGGGALMDAGCYCTMIVRHVLQAEPLTVKAAAKVHPENQVDVTFLGLMEFAGGVMGTISTSMEQPFRVWCEVSGAKGRVHVSSLFADSDVTISVQGQQSVVKRFEPGNLFAKQMTHFSQCVLEGTEPLITAEDAIGNADTLERLRGAVG